MSMKKGVGVVWKCVGSFLLGSGMTLMLTGSQIKYTKQYKIHRIE